MTATIVVEDGIIDSLIGPHSRLSSNSDAKPRGEKFVLGQGPSIIV